MDYRRPIEAIVPGAQGRVLGVLARTEAELNMRTLAELAGVSPTHVSRVMPRLVALGLVQRREIGSNSLFRMISHNLAARWIRALGSLHDRIIQELQDTSQMLDGLARNATLFGSFARGDMIPSSDVDILVIGPDDLDDPPWRDVLWVWQEHATQIVGNPVNLIEVTVDDAAPRLRHGQGMWGEILTEGIRLTGEPLESIVRTAT